MRRRMIRTICVLAICVMAITLLPATSFAGSTATRGASSGNNIHDFDYVTDNVKNKRSLWTTKVRKNNVFYINGNRPVHVDNGHYQFKGYYAYRRNDQKWYVSGKGWQKSNSGAKLYQPGQRLSFDSSWNRGRAWYAWNSNYMFYPQWKHVHIIRYYRDAGSKWTPISGWTCYYGDNDKFRVDRANQWGGVRWHLMRLDKSGTKFYVAGKGWKTQWQINNYGYRKAVYTRGNLLKLDKTWTKGSNGWADFGFIPAR